MHESASSPLPLSLPRHVSSVLCFGASAVEISATKSILRSRRRQSVNCYFGLESRVPLASRFKFRRPPYRPPARRPSSPTDEVCFSRPFLLPGRTPICPRLLYGHFPLNWNGSADLRPHPKVHLMSRRPTDASAAACGDFALRTIKRMPWPKG